MSTTSSNISNGPSGADGGARANSAGISDTASRIKDKIADHGEGLIADASKTIKAQAETAKDTVAREGKNVADALRVAADELRSGSAQERTMAQIADGIADLSQSMKDKDMGEIVGELDRFAKRNPAIFLGAAALIGFAAVRFAKASGDTNEAAK